ncbi:MAG: HEAT repeat domain-containing protein [Armatimonadota bacterium]|nr:HEAT repeat domain-containing protein [Armatimonadota bacterium]
MRQHNINRPADLNVLVKAAQDAEIGSSALISVERIDATASEDLRNALIHLIDVDDDTDDLRVLRTILRVIVKNKFPGSVERVRQRLSREPKTKIRTQDDLKRGWVDNWRKGKRIARVQELARALVALEDRQSLEMLFSLDEVLTGGSAGSMLTPLGKDALLYAASSYVSEEGLRREGCLAVIAMSTSPESIPELRKLIHANDAPLRRAALSALIQAKAPDIESLLEAAKSDEDESIRKLARNESFRISPLKNKIEIERLMASPDSREQLAILQLLAGSPPKGMEDTLENFIHQDEAANPGNPMMRFYAAAALWKLTGKKIEYSRGEATYKPYPWNDPAR